ncbi:MAG: inositol monophosphatase family protein [Spirochaetales bacterium]|nr:inositol monophosphatase family protein [Spirochaetales bacterium]
MNKITSTLKKAGRLLKKQYFKGSGFTEKEQYHLLSESDMEIHYFLKKHLEILFPGAAISSEEDQSEDTTGKSRGNRIIIDPIDGTTNFIMGKPYFTISVAVETGGEITEAHVYNPLSDEYYYADKKSGRSYYNNKVINVPSPTAMEDSIVVIGVSYKPEKINLYFKTWSRLLDSCRKCLFWVTPAQTICNVARGNIGVFIDMGCSTYGQSAGALILKNAGGRMFNYDGTLYDHGTTGGIFISGGVDDKEVLQSRNSSPA